jgi:hypothetical protein
MDISANSMSWLQRMMNRKMKISSSHDLWKLKLISYEDRGYYRLGKDGRR